MDMLTLYRDDGPVVQTVTRSVDGPAGGGRHRRLAWLLPAAVRAGEYGLVLWLGWRADALPSAFALLAALAYRHYDLVYRMRYQRVPPPAWLSVAGLGWDGRAMVLAAAALAGVYGPVATALAAWCAVLFVGESAAGWVRAARDPATVAAAVADDEE
jgi:hypothetical protein